MLLEMESKEGSTGPRGGGGGATHSKCFLIFSDSAYLEIPLMKRVRFTWGETGQVGLPEAPIRENAGRGGEQVSREEQTGVGGGLGRSQAQGKQGECF